MDIPLLVSADLAGHSGREERLLQLGAPLPPDAVVLVSTSAAMMQPTAALALGTWIVVGEGELPPTVQPFLRLPAAASPEVLGSAIDAAMQAVRLRLRLLDIERELRVAQDRKLDLARVGIALTGERDLDTLLALILSTSRELVAADAGSLYLIAASSGVRALRFILSQNDSVPTSLSSFTVPVDRTSFAGYVALSGEVVGVEDVRHLPPDVPYSFNPQFDVATGYHTRSLLTVPMATRAGEVIGVLQLLNRKADPQARITSAAAADAAVVPFGHDDVAVLRALAAQAAVAIENTRLVKEIESLFEGFVRASITAIEQRDPSTSGHSLRVAHYTVELARAVEQAPPAAYRGLRFTPDEITQLRYAGLLHDFGKVGVREAVLTKGKKLFPERLELVEERFRHARRAREVAILKRLLDTLCREGRAPTEDDVARISEAFQRSTLEIDSFLGAVVRANEPAVLNRETRHILVEVEQARFPGVNGDETPFLLPDELRVLSVPKGSLNEEERREIESHVSHSYDFLLTIPWPKRYRRIPEIAYGHHEKLNGTGYPNRLDRARIPPEVRMMTVSDIYDALAAGDRPYKRAVPPERALAIIEDEAHQGLLDADLVRVFIEARIWASETDTAEVVSRG
ncbi:MAG: GAF domain-containing protein [Thermoanaerobaculaceae bacterium]|nr:GAF domain-containing protein [Thermoanaerobaculaceae bacterium]NLH10660.1 GAF domain-containing protein [Holophagae bacterium]HPW55809.1 HD domain-containing phosphohydrolase [Thermoanaerobaculaceae bacterium]